MSRHLLAEIPESTVLGFDWSADALQVANKEQLLSPSGPILRMKIVVTTLVSLGNIEINDLALSLGVVEHFPDPAEESSRGLPRSWIQGVFWYP